MQHTGRLIVVKLKTVTPDYMHDLLPVNLVHGQVHNSNGRPATDNDNFNLAIYLCYINAVAGYCC